MEWFHWLGLDVVIPMKDKLNLKLFLVWDYHYFYDHIKLHFYRCLTLIKCAIEMRNIAIIVDELQFQVKHHDCTQNYNHLDKLKYFCLFSRGRKSNYFLSILINHYNIQYIYRKYDCLRNTNPCKEFFALYWIISTTKKYFIILFTYIF